MSKTKTAQKLANLNRAAADQRVTHLACRLLLLMVSDADNRTGIVRRRQSRFAKVLGVHRRTVQRCRDDLVELSYLWPLGEVRKGIIKGYSVIPPEHAAPAPQVDAAPGPHVAAKHAAPAPHLGNMRHQDRRDAAPAPPTCGTSAAHKEPSSYPISNIPSAHLETEAGAPRLRADALGALRQDNKAREGLANGHAGLAPATTDRPFPEQDAAIRTLLGEHSRLAVGSRTMEFDGQSIRIVCPTDAMANALRPFADDIAAGLGVDQVRFGASHGLGLRKMA